MLYSNNAGMLKSVPDLPRVSEVYAGTKILVTGFTGFLGKLIVEKLLWECQDIHMIYVLMRPKKGSSIQERLENTLACQAFNRIRENCPHQLQKIISVEAEISMEGLGLSEESRKMLLDSDIVIHCASNVRFDQPLKYVINANVRSTRDLVELAKCMPNIKSFVYVGTAYSNSDKVNVEIEERLYPAPLDWKEIIDFVNNTCDPEKLAILTMKILGDFVNTYVFSKHLAEHIINDVKCELPVVICRPSVVLAALEEPFPYFLENLFGPLGLSVGYYTGVVRYREIIQTNEINYIFSDVVIRNIILAGWKRAIDPPQKEDDEIQVYNAATNTGGGLTPEDYFYVITRASRIKLNNMMYVIFTGFQSRFLYWFHLIFGYALSGYLIDAVASLTGNKFRIMTLRKRITYSMESLLVFGKKPMYFKNQKFTELPYLLKDVQERVNFDCSTNFNWLAAIVGTTDYGVHNIHSEIFLDVEKYHDKYLIMYCIDLGVIWLVYSIIGALIYYLAFHKYVFHEIFYFVSMLLTL